MYPMNIHLLCQWNIDGYNQNTNDAYGVKELDTTTILMEAVSM